VRSEDSQSKLFSAPIYWAHRAVFFAIAMLSCSNSGLRYMNPFSSQGFLSGLCLALVALASTSRHWPRPQPQGLGLGLGLEILASFNITEFFHRVRKKKKPVVF